MTKNNYTHGCAERESNVLVSAIYPKLKLCI